jgi:hypothetical protein
MMRRLFTRSPTPTPPDPSREIPAVVALRIASLFAFLEGRFTSEHACGDASLEAVCALAHQRMIPITLDLENLPHGGAARRAGRDVRARRKRRDHVARRDVVSRPCLAIGRRRLALTLRC